MPLGDGSTFVVINRSAPASNLVLQMRDRILAANALQEQIAAQLSEMDAADCEAVFGVPAASAAQFATIVDGVGTGLNVAAINSFLSNIG